MNNNEKQSSPINSVRAIKPNPKDYKSDSFTIINYRPEIDGIRAFAIIAVLVYHAFPQLCPGGLIGVDVFFVISGYLITTILISSLGHDTKPILNFYIRRIRRIFPALIVVLISVYAFGYIALYADEFKELGLHILSGATFTSNFVYLREAGYFDRSAELKPLLHLWSLAIEEQFYLCWPPLLLLALKFKKITLTHLITLLFLASFTVSLWLSQQYPSGAYYFPFCRFWEILAGCYLAALNSQNAPATVSLKASNFINSIALLIILSSVFWINGQKNFPGWQALPVVLATACLIRYSNRNHWTYSCLANRGMVAIGLISYPLYLWHWSILSFLAITELQTSPMQRFGGLALAFVLAALTYKLIERPIRRTMGKTALALICGLLLVGFIGFNTYKRDGLDHRQVGYQNMKAQILSGLGFEQRHVIPNQDGSILNTNAFLKVYPDYPLKLEKVSKLLKSNVGGLATREVYNPESVRNAKIGNQLKVVVIGDSYADNFGGSLRRTHHDIEITSFCDSGCTPIRRRYRDQSNRCKKLLDKAYDFAKKNPDSLIVLAARWPISFYPLAEDIQRFSKLGTRMAIVGPSVIYSKDVNNILLRYQSGDDIVAFTNSFIEKDNFALNDAMRKFCEEQKVAFIDKINIFCGEGLCRLTLTGNELFIYDDGHLTAAGEQYFGGHLKANKTIYKITDKTSTNQGI